MPTASDRHRNNVRMGVFVSLSLVLAFGIIIALTGAMSSLRGGYERHTVRFSVQTGVANLKSGSEVRVGGMRLGEVTHIEPHFGADSSSPFRHIDVHFRLDRNVRLFDNARIQVSTPLIGAEAWLDITHVGDGALAVGVIEGAERMGLLSSMLGDEGAMKVQRMLDDSQQFTAFLASLGGEYERSVMPIMQELHATSTGARQLVDAVREEHWPQWAGSIDEVLLWAVLSTGKLDDLLDEGHGLLGDGRGVIAENREDVRIALSNVAAATGDLRETAHRINTETIEQVHTLLNTGQAGLDNAVAALESLRADYDHWATHLGEAMSRANLAAQQLHLTMIEVRRSPWKVLYRPSDRELEHELLYEAARSFAAAAADLKAASQAAQRVLDNHGDRLADDDGMRERITRNLLGPLEKYELAQQRLLDVLFADR